jgi:O-antigen/teichoic acid export membrane protein
MPHSSHHLARGILRNAGALFLVGAFAKSAGLVIAILVARFLGPDATGLYALLFSIAFLVETFISLGMSDSLVRDVAARPAEARELYLASLKLVVRVGLVPAAALAIAAYLAGDESATRSSLLIIAVGAPISGAFVVSQAAIQGRERVLLLTWVTFLARIFSIGLLVFAFYRGAGVAAAFGARVLYQALSLACFSIAMRRDPVESRAGHTARSLLTRSVPFAMNKAIREVGIRLPSFVLPGSVGLAAAGIFEAANRLRSTLAMVMSASVVGLMPAFARNLAGSASEADRLVGFSMKYMCVAMSALATGVALLAGWIIELLYGAAFSAASRPLQILIWAQVVTAVDAVLQQAMLARGDVYPAIRNSAAGVIGQLALIFAAAAAFGLQGAACAVLVSALLTLVLDLHFVVRNVAPISVRHFAVAPLAAATVVGATMLFVDQQPFAIRLIAAIGTWALAMALFRVLPRAELRFMWQILRMRRGESAKAS